MTPFADVRGNRITYPAERAAGEALEVLKGAPFHLEALRFAGLFDAFLNVIPFQQLSLDAGGAIVARLVKRFGASVEHGGRRCYATPTPSVIAAARLSAVRACGLSARKAEALRSIARTIESGKMNEERLAGMSSAEAVRHLCELEGLGPWTASVVLLRGLGRLDVFPPGHVGAARGLGKLLKLADGASTERVAQKFGRQAGLPIRSFAGERPADARLDSRRPERSHSTRSPS